MVGPAVNYSLFSLQVNFPQSTVHKTFLKRSSDFDVDDGSSEDLYTLRKIFTLWSTTKSMSRMTYILPGKQLYNGRDAPVLLICCKLIWNQMTQISSGIQRSQRPFDCWWMNVEEFANSVIVEFELIYIYLSRSYFPTNVWYLHLTCT